MKKAKKHIYKLSAVAKPGLPDCSFVADRKIHTCLSIAIRTIRVLCIFTKAVKKRSFLTTHSNMITNEHLLSKCD